MASPGDDPDDVKEESVRVEEVMIRVRDGIRLQSYLYVPPGGGPFPGLLARCMYGADRVAPRAEAWAEKGYAVLLQNVRGRHGSEGGPVSRDDCPEDGYDTIEWMASQAWCNGRIGTFGGSALARVQVATAFLGHTAHCAMAPVVLPYRVMSHLGGALMFSQIPQWMYLAQSGTDLGAFETIDWMTHLYRLPVTSVLDQIGGPIDQYREIVTNAHRDYFNDPLDPDAFRTLATPNLIVTGWYDHCSTGSIDFFLHTMQHASERQKRNTHLVIGPWDHSLSGDAAHEYDFGPEGRLVYGDIEEAFFEQHLKEVVPVRPLPAVKIFVMGKNEWRDEQEWPLARTQERRLYLHSGGDIRGAWTRGALSFDPPGDEPADRFTYDPAHPVPSWGGANSGPAVVLPMSRGPRDQRITLYREDVLTFYSDSLQEPLEVTGAIKLVLYAASTASDTDFTARLMDIAPDGNARLLSDGVVRARFRNGVDKAELIDPGEVYCYEIDLWSTSNEFQPGHRVALAISSSNFPRIDRNLNTGGDNQRDGAFITAEQTVFHDERHPSHVVLPVIDS